VDDSPTAPEFISEIKDSERSLSLRNEEGTVAKATRSRRALSELMRATPWRPNHVWFGDPSSTTKNSLPFGKPFFVVGEEGLEPSSLIGNGF
jgi:hypothetical protein